MAILGVFAPCNKTRKPQHSLTSNTQNILPYALIQKRIERYVDFGTSHALETLSLIYHGKP